MGLRKYIEEIVIGDGFEYLSGNPDKVKITDAILTQKNRLSTHNESSKWTFGTDSGEDNLVSGSDQLKLRFSYDTTDAAVLFDIKFNNTGTWSTIPGSTAIWMGQLVIHRGGNEVEVNETFTYRMDFANDIQVNRISNTEVEILIDAVSSSTNNYPYWGATVESIVSGQNVTLEESTVQPQ